MPSWFVCVMGMGTVFIGLIFLIIICKIMSLFFKKNGNKPAATPASANVKTNANANAGAPIQNKQEIIAATCAVIAEELGEDVSNIRVVSFKRV